MSMKQFTNDSFVVLLLIAICLGLYVIILDNIDKSYPTEQDYYVSYLEYSEWFGDGSLIFITKNYTVFHIEFYINRGWIETNQKFVSSHNASVNLTFSEISHLFDLCHVDYNIKEEKWDGYVISYANVTILNSSQIQRVESLIANSDFFNLNNSYTENRRYEAIHYLITVVRNVHKKEVYILNSSGPEELNELKFYFHRTAFDLRTDIP